MQGKRRNQSGSWHEHCAWCAEPLATITDETQFAIDPYERLACAER